MCAEDDTGMLASAKTREGYVKPLGKAWKKVTYAEIDNRAIFEGCVILGTVENLKKSAEKLDELTRDNPDLLTKPKAETHGIGILGQQFRWPKRTIPFVINPDLPNQKRVTDAIDHWHQKTSIRFKARTTEKDFVRIKRVTSGCASAVGRQGGEQELILADTCTVGNIIHELGHTIGLWHEQSRADRNKFIKIVMTNVVPGLAHNFNQHILDGIDLNTYDFGSIMHYPAVAFPIDATKPTIVPLKPLPPGVVMGQRKALSAGDIAAVEKMYEKEPKPV
jgi:hypothetical protein